VLAALSRATPARWCTWVSPPHELCAPALEAHGVALDRMLFVRTHLAATAAKTSQRRRSGGVHMLLWALEQALRSGACELALAWLPRASPRAIRRLQLAAEQGRALGVLFRSQRFAQLASPAMLRVLLEPVKEPGRHGARVTLLKSRGGSREPIDLTWTAAAA
jgi:cell division inhibitor SulA